MPPGGKADAIYYRSSRNRVAVQCCQGWIKINGVDQIGEQGCRVGSAAASAQPLVAQVISPNQNDVRPCLEGEGLCRTCSKRQSSSAKKDHQLDRRCPQDHISLLAKVWVSEYFRCARKEIIGVRLKSNRCLSMIPPYSRGLRVHLSQQLANGVNLDQVGSTLGVKWCSRHHRHYVAIFHQLFRTQPALDFGNELIHGANGRGQPRQHAPK